MSVVIYAAYALHIAAVLVLPILMAGTVNRTKAVWAGRKGPKLFQTLFELARLCRKAPVYSRVTTPLFWIGPIVALATAFVSGLIVPVLGFHGPLSFQFDFVVVAYLWGLGRMAIALAALDTGSSFEGMGASRDLTYSAFVEPALFLGLGTLVAATGHTAFAEILWLGIATPDRAFTTVAIVVVLLVVLQVESARVPADDPNTHLELTMVHEVMILDHSGPDLAAIQYASAIKMTLAAALIAALVNPVSPETGRVLSALTHVTLMFFVAIGTGLVESLVARLKLRVIPHYIAVATILAGVALLTTAWRLGGHG